MNLRDAALKAAGATALATAAYHGVHGGNMIRAIEMSEKDMDFVSATYQLGTTGWVAGGVLLLAAAGMPSQQARNWIVGVTAVLFGIPAFGSIALTGGKPSGGGLALAATVGLALLGRRRDVGAAIATRSKAVAGA